jgi:hypothetical protein
MKQLGVKARKFNSRYLHLVLPDLIAFVTFREEWKMNIKT